MILMDKPPEKTTSARVRLIIDTDEDIRAAIRLRISRENVTRAINGEDEMSHSEAVNAVLRVGFADELREIKAVTRKTSRKKDDPK
jgi:3'-phosphoadenosine 5'-phosphosulfate sulfotransferase